jgi:carboxyl-terminal processing protease
MVPHFKREDKKGDQIISISNLKKTLQVSCNTLEAISNMILSDANKKNCIDTEKKLQNFEVLVEKIF